MLNSRQIDSIVQQIDAAEKSWLGRNTNYPEEEHKSGSIAEAINAAFEGSPSGVSISVNLVKRKVESDTGADLEIIVDMRLGAVSTRKRLLVQAKRSGFAGLTVIHDGDGHWLYDGRAMLAKSDTAHITTPGERLQEQCEKMLDLCHSSFVWIYSSHQIAVVSAVAVKNAKPPAHGQKVRLGTKRISDLFVHVLQCFIGDEIKPSNTTSLNQPPPIALAPIQVLVRVNAEFPPPEGDDDDERFTETAQ